MYNSKSSFLIIFTFLVLIAFFVPIKSVFADNPQGLVPCNGVQSGGNFSSVEGVSNNECTFSDLIALFNRVIRFLLFDIAAPLATIAFVYAGFLYITAAGDTGKIAKAHDIFKKVLMGLILAFGAFLIVTAILKGLEIKDPFIDQIIQPN